MRKTRVPILLLTFCSSNPLFIQWKVQIAKIPSLLYLMMGKHGFAHSAPLAWKVCTPHPHCLLGNLNFFKAKQDHHCQLLSQPPSLPPPQTTCVWFRQAPFSHKAPEPQTELAPPHPAPWPWLVWKPRLSNDIHLVVGMGNSGNNSREEVCWNAAEKAVSQS